MLVRRRASSGSAVALRRRRASLRLGVRDDHVAVDQRSVRRGLEAEVEDGAPVSPVGRPPRDVPGGDVDLAGDVVAGPLEERHKSVTDAVVAARAPAADRAREAMDAQNVEGPAAARAPSRGPAAQVDPDSLQNAHSLEL